LVGSFHQGMTLTVSTVDIAHLPRSGRLLDGSLALIVEQPCVAVFSFLTIFFSPDAPRLAGALRRCR
jgi:hypothetical protein